MSNGVQQQQQAQNTAAAFQSKSDKLFPKLNKEVESLESYYKKSLDRYKACLLALGNLFTPLEVEQVVLRVKSAEIIEFLKRLFMFDFKKLIKNSRMNSEARCLIKIMSDMLNTTMKFAQIFFNTLETNLLSHGNTISCMLANFGYFISEEFLFDSISNYYECLSCWIETCGPSCGLYKYSTAILNTLLECIKPFRTNIISVWKLN